MTKIIQFFSTIIDAIVTVVEFISTSVSYLVDIISALPAFVVAPLTVAVSVLVLYAIIGRGN